jgi:bifunctional DNA-binding transcriptional regulator/antitoxin component of YhaV-PrlF toxin-antitoxin module
VRTALGLKGGDVVTYVIADGHAVLSRLDDQQQTGDPFATFGEWGSAADAEGYGTLWPNTNRL